MTTIYLRKKPKWKRMLYFPRLFWRFYRLQGYIKYWPKRVMAAYHFALLSVR